MHNLEKGCYVITPVRHLKLLREGRLKSLIDPSCWWGNFSRVPGSWLLIKSARAVWGAEMLLLSTKEQPCVLKGSMVMQCPELKCLLFAFPLSPVVHLHKSLSLGLFQILIPNSNSNQNASVYPGYQGIPSVQSEQMCGSTDQATA